MALSSYVNNGKVFIRFVAFSPMPMNGYHRFGDVLQMFSLPDDAPKPEYLWGDHPFIIEYMYDEIAPTELAGQDDVTLKDSRPTFDRQLSLQYDFNKQDEVLTILSVITKYLLKNDSGKKSWVLCKDDVNDEWRSVYKGTGYFWEGLSGYKDSFTEHDLDGLPMIDGNEYYGNVAAFGEPFMLCDRTSELLDKYFSLDKKKSEAFLSACILFRQAARTWEISHSLAYVGFVSSLEALIQYERKGSKTKRCDICKKPDYEVTEKFREFARKYGADDDDFIKYASEIYGRRSAIGHRGKLMSQDVAGRVIPLQDEMNDSRELMNLVKIVRVCLINWLTQSP